MARKRKDDDLGRYAYEGLDRIMHEKARLSILTSLATSPTALFFNDLKKLCNLTDGNLSRHIATLSDANLIEMVRGSAGKRPQSLVRLTEEGAARFRDYLEELERVISDGLKKKPEASLYPEGWSPA